jgi:predicted NBD/HSP70 family sugar kinase
MITADDKIIGIDLGGTKVNVGLVQNNEIISSKKQKLPKKCKDEWVVLNLIINLTKEMAIEYAAKKINVNCIAPGIIKTAMTKEMLADPQTKQFLESSTLYPRLGKPEDIAHATVYLASSESDFVNGEVLVVDGGWIAK